MRTAEEAMWDEACAIEKERIERLQDQQVRKGKESKAIFRPEKVQKPWTWGSGASSSLHTIEERLVYSVTEFDFDLRAGLETLRDIAVPCEASGEEADLGDEYPSLGGGD